MDEYKDITELKKQISDFKKTISSPNSDYMNGYISALSVIEGMIEGLPIADVVEVVRCIDCKHRYHGACCCPFLISQTVQGQHFCSYCERKPPKGE